jgi:uncharacterized protein YdaU (DUF1376 family)
MSPNHQSGMTFAKFFPSDWRTGCLSLNIEEEGLYIRACMFHYDTGRALPDDYSEAARLLNVQIHKYRKVMDALIEKGKIIRGQGTLFNERVVEEIDKYRLMLATRSDAARKREERKAEMQREIERAMSKKATPQVTPPLTQGVTPPLTPHLTPPVSLGVTPPVTPGVEDKKANEINETEAQEKQRKSRALDNQNPEARIQKPESSSSSVEHDAGAGRDEDDPLHALNGTAIELTKFIRQHANVEHDTATDMLANNIRAFTADAMMEAYATTVAALRSRTPIARPYQYLIKIAGQIKRDGAGGSRRKTTEVEERRARIRRVAEETEAEVRGRRA